MSEEHSDMVLKLARAEGYAQAERDIVAWLKNMPRGDAMALWRVSAKPTLNSMATAITQSKHRPNTGEDYD